MHNSETQDELQNQPCAYASDKIDCRRSSANRGCTMSSYAKIVELPFDLDPVYRSYLTPSYYLGILGCYCDLRPLLASYFIGLALPTDRQIEKGVGALIPDLPELSDLSELGYLGMSTYEETGESFCPCAAIEWIIEKLNCGEYIYVTVNEYFLPDTFSFNRKNFAHPCLILGCDVPQRRFTICNYSKMGDYRLLNILFSDLAKCLAIRGPATEQQFNGHYQRRILALNPSPQVRARFDFSNTRKRLRGYLSGQLQYERPSSGRIPWITDPEGYTFGIRAFASYSNYIKWAVDRGIKVDMRNTRVLFEQKKIMSNNISYFGELFRWTDTDSFLKLHQPVIEWAHKLHLLAFAYNLDYKTGCRLSDFASNIDHIVEIDRKLLTILCDLLDVESTRFSV